jgi:hypothetical protein
MVGLISAGERHLRPLGLLLAVLLPAGCTGTDPAGGSGSAGQVGAPTASGGTTTQGGSATFGGSAGAGGSSQGGTAVGVGGGGTIGGSGGSTAGSGGAAGSGAGGSNGTCSPNYLLCEDFEAAGIGTAPLGWTAHGNASVAEDQANRGKHSLKISPANNGERRIYHPTDMVGAQHWGRVYYRVQLPVPDAFVHSTLVTFFGKGPTVGNAEFRVVDTVKDAKTGGFAGGKHQFLYNVQPNGAEFGTGSSYDYNFEDKWHCAEWHVDAADQSYHFYYDSKEVIGFAKGAGKFSGSELPNGFQEVRLGWNNYQSSPPGFTAWLDDFALADVRVGCLP